MTKLLTTILLLTFVSQYSEARKVESLNRGWLFSCDSLYTNVREVNVPHDFQIEQPWVVPSADERPDNSDVAANIKSRLSARGFKEMGTGWYKKVIDIQPQTGCRYLLDFEGIMLTGDVYLNGRHIGGTDYGYVGFEIDITKHLKRGKNILEVKASTMGEKNSRWYTGGGLFRNVSLVTTSDDLFLERHPLRITTRENRFVSVTAELTNRTKSKTVKIGLKLYDPNGELVYEHTDTRQRITPSRTMEAVLTEAEVSNPKLWDTDHPQLYKAVVTLMREDGSVADEVEEEFGIRTIEFGPAFGLKLNGKKVLLKGIANHHTLGALGAAAYPRAIEKRLLLLKRFGVNHIRTSHNPYSRDFIRLCDKHGILVVDELYDKWTDTHSGGRVPFMNHWAQDLTEFIKRDRNSPSVVLWSLGNELQQEANQPFGDFGVTCYKMMRAVLERYDSTRKVTVAMHPRYRNWQTDSIPCDLALQTDVQAYNYRYMYFPSDGRRYPWMTFYQSEASTKDMGQNYFGMDLDSVIGLAYWGAIDYLGESQGWPAKGWAQGVFDISLEPKPKAYLMKSLFCEEPVVNVAVREERGERREEREMRGTRREERDILWNGVVTGSEDLSEQWNRTEGSTADLVVYTNADEVELLLNGRSLGRRENPTDAKQRNQICWDDVTYEQGKIEAVAYRKGRAVARHALETTGPAVRLKVEYDNNSWQSDGTDLQHLRVYAVDSEGRRVFSCTDELSFRVEGDAKIVAVTNGDISSDELNVTDHRRLWQGAAMVVLRAGTTPSKVTLTTSSKSLGSVVTELATRHKAQGESWKLSVLETARKTNDYFMQKYSDPTEDTFVRNKKRPSSLWTRAVYYEGLMALNAIDPQQRYLDYTQQWADYHKWTPRNGVTTTHADDQCCEQTYIEYRLLTGKGTLEPTKENLERQMASGRTDYWTWIDAIQMAMPVYVKMYAATKERKYLDYAMRCYEWTRDSCGGGCFNVKEGLWWRDKDYVSPYKEKDGKNCYWSRGNGWVYAALVRSMELLSPDSKEYKLLKNDFLLMSEALLKCQYGDGFWRASLLSDAEYPGPEMTGTALFLYGMSWGIRHGLLKEKKYRPACDKAWEALERCVHENGFLAWNQGTGKDPSAGQPVTLTSVPDFEDYGTGCFLLGATEYFRLIEN